MVGGRIWILVIAIAWIASATISPALAQIKGESDLQRMVDAMHPGWNLGNTLDATGSETSWGNPRTTQELIQQIAAAGFKSIRIPITWRHRMGLPPDYKIDPAFLNRVQEIVDWSLDAGLYVMINTHHDSSWIFTMQRERESVLARFRAAWTQIAAHFKEYPHTLIFEGVNEPRFDHDWGKDSPVYFEMVHELQTTFHDIVRRSGGNNATRPLVLTTLTGGTSRARMNQLYKTIETLNDDRIIATIHYYGYYPFSVNLAGATRFDRTAIIDLEQAFDRAYETFVARGIPVIVGEYGLLGFDRALDAIQHGEMLKFFEWLTYYGKEKRLALMWWDNGQHFNRRTFRWTDESIYKVIMASLEARSSNAESDSIMIKRGAPITDQRIRLNLHGNELVEIAAGDEVLTPETDYELVDETLILKAATVERFLSEELGVSATLTLKFSAGADWTMFLIHYDTPQLSDAVGTTTSFSVPTRFNGDRLTTMEARYARGGNAGPADWTPFKEFHAAFSPAYATNQIQLKREFFNEVKDGEVVLKFHFLSGTVVEYLLVKEGVKVVGTAR